MNPDDFDRAAGDSREQQEAEGFLVAALSNRAGVELRRRDFEDPEGEWLEVDGYCDSPLILCEAWAHLGRPKSAQKNKVMADAFKLLYLERLISKPAQKVLLFADEAAARHFRGRSWMARALKAYGIEVQVVELPEEIRAAVRKAQQRQFR